MYGSDTTTEDSERTAFRKAEKIYKLYYDHNAKSSKKYDLESPISISFFGCSQCIVYRNVAYYWLLFLFSFRKKLPRSVDLSEVLDFKSILDCYNCNGELPPGVSLLKCHFDRPVFRLESRPGM